VDTATDPKHCGSCSNDCTALPGAGADAACKAGVCVLGGCADGKADCNNDPSDGCETDTTTAEHCGACGVAWYAAQACLRQEPGHRPEHLRRQLPRGDAHALRDGRA